MSICEDSKHNTDVVDVLQYRGQHQSIQIFSVLGSVLHSDLPMSIIGAIIWALTYTENLLTPKIMEVYTL